MYVFNSDRLNGKAGERIHHEMVLPALREVKGYVKVFAFDCVHPTMTAERLQMFPACDSTRNVDDIPVFNLMVPPVIRVNPYTGKPMQKQMLGFQEGQQIGKNIFKKWVLSNMPDYTHSVKTVAQYERLTSREDDINKVVLFTNMPVPPAAFKAVAAEYRDRLRFYIISVSTLNQDDRTAL